MRASTPASIVEGYRTANRAQSGFWLGKPPDTQHCPNHTTPQSADKAALCSWMWKTPAKTQRSGGRINDFNSTMSLVVNLLSTVSSSTITAQASAKTYEYLRKLTVPDSTNSFRRVAILWLYLPRPCRSPQDAGVCGVRDSGGFKRVRHDDSQRAAARTRQPATREPKSGHRPPSTSRFVFERQKASRDPV